MVAGARDGGAEVVVGGNRPEGPLSQGWFYLPTVLVGGEPVTAGAAPDAPVVRVCTWRHPAELRTARPTDLWSERVSIWSDDLPVANALATTLQVGQVYINAGPVAETDAVWQTRGCDPRSRTREPGLIPRGPGSRPSTAAGPAARRLAADRTCDGEPPDVRAVNGVPASWGGQVRGFAACRLGLAQLRPIGRSRHAG